MCTYTITVVCAAGGEIRLVGGSTDREGRVEVGVGGRQLDGGQFALAAKTWQFWQALFVHEHE